MSTIITVADLSGYYGKDLSEDARAQSVVDSVNSWIEAYTGRVFGETKTITETHDYEPVIFLNYVDIGEIIYLKAFGESLPEARYGLSKETGRVLLGFEPKRSSRGFYDAVEVQYTTGITTVPAELKNAALQIASDNYNRTDNSGSDISSESVGGYSVSYGGNTNATSGTNLASGAQSPITDPMAVLNFYRIRGI